jgi:hypothetical protein
MDKAQLAFEASVPAHLQDDVMQMIAEAAAGWSEHASVTILDRDRMDAINVRAHGIVTVEGTEYRFILRDGNNDGTVLEDWDGDAVFEHHKPTVYALQPARHLIDSAVMAGRGPFLLMKWDAMLSNHRDIAEIPRKYAYDRYVQPGVVSERHYREAAAKHHFVLVDEETAAETRTQLAAATEPFTPSDRREGL